MQKPLSTLLPVAVFAVIALVGCRQEKKETGTVVERAQAHEIPKQELAAIQKEFPGAMPYRSATDTLLAQLKKMGILSEHILWGQSTCVDDITNTKNKLIHPEIKGPFIFGGLAGLPFTGITGVNAFSHHVPENGTALLFVGPHIGYCEKEGWGKIVRHGHEHSSSCCGALMAALGKLKAGEIKQAAPSEDDYQEQTLEQLALRHKDEILDSNEPLTAYTKIVCKEAEDKMTAYAREAHERHFAYAVVVVGVIINTDYQYDDYLWVDHVAVKDIKKDVWLERH